MSQATVRAPADGYVTAVALTVSDRALQARNALGGTSVFPAEISVPDEMSRDSLRLGMSGNATAFADNAGVIGLLALILVWISAYTAYL